MALPTYASRFLVAAWGGQSLEGFAPDSSITMSRSVDLKEFEVGSDGQTMVSILPDRSGTCTLSFQQASPSNVILAGVVAYEEANNIPVVGNMTITSPDGSLIAFLRGAQIMTTPEMTRGSTATGSTQDWVFYAEEMIFTATPDGTLVPSDEVARIASAVDTIIANNLI